MAKKYTKIIFNTIILTLIGCGIIWVSTKFIHLRSSTYTDNAQIYKNMVAVNSKIQGFIKEVRFEDYQYVNKGDTLVIIDDAEYLLALAQARSNYQNALVAKSATGKGIKTASNNTAVSEAALVEVKANLDNAEKNYRRYENMLSKGAVTQLEYDNVKTGYLSLKARYETMLRQKQSAELVESELSERLDQNDAGIAIAEAALNLAQLNYSYTVITAPCSGYTSGKDIESGELVQPGMKLLSIVNDDEVWVIANYREKQLEHIAIDTPVEIYVDALRGKTYHGKVNSISDATGSKYSFVPQDNATGNFVKVEQRVPVKIIFTEENSPEDLALLKNGFNVECKILK